MDESPGLGEYRSASSNKEEVNAPRTVACAQHLNAATLKKRGRLDIYADILEVLKRQPEGVLITRISYGAGLPIDRIRPMLEALTHCELVSVHVKGPPLQSSFTHRRFFYVTRKGLEFLDAYHRIHNLLTYLEETNTTKKEKPTTPIDFVGFPEQTQIRSNEGPRKA